MGNILIGIMTSLFNLHESDSTTTTTSVVISQIYCPDLNMSESRATVNFA